MRVTEKSTFVEMFVEMCSVVCRCMRGSSKTKPSDPPGQGVVNITHASINQMLQLYTGHCPNTLNTWHEKLLKNNEMKHF